MPEHKLIPLPKSGDPEWLLDCTPRPVQLEALRRSIHGVQTHADNGDFLGATVDLRPGTSVGWGHYLEMRLGKTPLSLNEMMLLRHYHGVKRFLVVAPNTYKPEWREEAIEFGFDLDIHDIDASQAKKQLPEINTDKPFVMTVSYEGIKTQLIKPFIEKHMLGTNTAMYLDESIKIKGNTSQTSKLALLWSKEMEFRRCLSGRPITQGPQDLYMQLRVMGHLDGKSFYAFRNKYAKMGGFKNRQVVGVKNEDQLSELLRYTSFTAKRQDWGDAGDPEYEIDKPALAPIQMEVYREITHEFCYIFEDEETVVTTEQVVTKLLKLQQASSGFLISDDKKEIPLMPFEKVPKIERLLEFMEEANCKVIVCYHYNYTGDRLLEVLAKYNPAQIRAKQIMKRDGVDAEQEKKKFNLDPSCRVIVCSMEAVKYGNTLQGNEDDRCEAVVFVENTYSLDTRAQVEMRNQAAIQKWPTLYLDFASSPVERNVIKALSRKESILEAVFGTYKNGEMKNDESM